MAVAPWILSDELWELIEPLLPKKQRRFRYPGRWSDRQALQGILFVLHTGIAWTHLPRELGFGSGVTCWRRLDEWQRAGVWERLHAELLGRLRAAGEIEWSRAVVDSSQIQAKKGLRNGPEPGRQRASRLQAPSPRRRQRAPTRLGTYRLQSQRRHPADPAPRGCPGGGRSGRPASSPARVPARRPRL
jgi:transposase